MKGEKGSRGNGSVEGLLKCRRRTLALGALSGTIPIKIQLTRSTVTCLLTLLYSALSR